VEVEMLIPKKIFVYLVAQTKDFGRTKEQTKNVRRNKMPKVIYINRKDSHGNFETVDQFNNGRKYAIEMLKEYRLGDSSGYYYISQRCCKDWR
jgi:hypothetical protein